MFLNRAEKVGKLCQLICCDDGLILTRFLCPDEPTNGLRSPRAIVVQPQKKIYVCRHIKIYRKLENLKQNPGSIEKLKPTHKAFKRNWRGSWQSVRNSLRDRWWHNKASYCSIWWISQSNPLVGNVWTFAVGERCFGNQRHRHLIIGVVVRDRMIL